MLGLFGSGKPDHPLADPKEAKRLIDELPAQDPLKALEEIAHWHESVGAAEGFRPDARFQLLFQLDEAAQPRLRKVAREYLAAARPSRFQENRLWTHVYEYWRQCGQAYARTIDTVLQGAKGAEATKPQLPLAVSRALRAIAQQVKWLHLRYAPVDATIWRVLNGVYAFAELRGIADAAVPAVYPGVPGESSPKLEFVRALALDISSPDSLLPAQVEAAERLIGDFAPSFALGAQAAPHATHWTDLGQGMGPQRIVRPSQGEPGAGVGVRYLSSGPALQALQAMLARIEATSILPEAFGPGAPINDGEGALDLLRHLILYWAPAAPERKHPRHNVKSRLSIVHGFDGVVAALSAGPGAGAPSVLEMNPAENWIVENVSAGGFGAVVPQAKVDWLKIGTLLAMQPDGGHNWLVGVIRRVSKSSSQEARVGIQTLSRAPELAKFAVLGREETGVLLPAPGLGSGEASIALRAGAFIPGQNLLTDRAGKHYMYMPQGVAERGDDYDIVRFREMVREA
ncbi:MAG TPA: hypothetical protein VG873_13245 [Burkholderiales bacterium]|nr:hypothetical protein [Burkholderiales bacterium]